MEPKVNRRLVSVSGSDCGTDRGRKQHRHALSLALVPGLDQALGILKHLGIGRASSGRFLLGGLPAPILHLATIEAHRALSPCDFEILRRGFSFTRDFLVFDGLAFI